MGGSVLVVHSGEIAELAMIACKKDRPRITDFVLLEATGQTTLEHVRARSSFPWLLKFKCTQSRAGSSMLALSEGTAFMVALATKFNQIGNQGAIRIAKLPFTAVGLNRLQVTSTGDSYCSHKFPLLPPIILFAFAVSVLTCLLVYCQKIECRYFKL